MKLSIITINLNNSSGLKLTIESVVNQTSQEFEYIVIDGGSTDGSVEVIKQYEDRITYWGSEPDRGIYHAMNKGIVVARGKYCQFLNSGDSLVDKDVTQNMLFNLPDSCIIYGNTIKVLPNGKLCRDTGPSGQKNSLLTFYKGTINHASSYIQRSLFDKYGLYDETLKIVSDWKLYLVAIGINGESVAYRNIDVSYFDTQGISNIQIDLLAEERKMVLASLLPTGVLNDYIQYSFDIERMGRLKRFWISRNLVCLLERALFKLEKWWSILFQTNFKKHI